LEHLAQLDRLKKLDELRKQPQEYKQQLLTISCLVDSKSLSALEYLEQLEVKGMLKSSRLGPNF
jgi:hypothetical protein